MSQRYFVTGLGRRPNGGTTGVDGSDGDVFMIRYEWPGTLGGQDADTLTGLEPGTGTSVDGVKNASGAPTNYVGYASGTSTYSIGTSDPNGNYYFVHGGDNTSAAGQEVILIKPSTFFNNFPNVNLFKVGLYLNWFSAIGRGCLNVYLKVYSGGTYTLSGGSSKDITTTGTLRRTYSFNANTNNANNPGVTGYPSNGINGYAQIGIFTFNRQSNGTFSYNLNSVGNCGEDPNLL
jgi:hypothetical protein